MATPRFMLPAAYEATTEYVRQYAEHRKDPKRFALPSTSMLLPDATHGPITDVALVRLQGRELVATSLRGRNPRFFDALDYAAMSLGTALGMGCSVQDTGSAFGYPRLRVAHPKGQIIYLIRIFTNAKPWEVARQHHPDYHVLDREHLSKHSVRKFWDQGKVSRVPKLGREAFYEAVQWYWARNHERAGITVSLEDHIGTIRLALELNDRLQVERDTQTTTDAT